MAAPATASTGKVPTTKEKKYDRQLRLWGAEGQEALENAHVLLINAGAGVVGTEALKNLILPSVGQFTVYEDAQSLVTEADLGVNFFLGEDKLGAPRAQALCEYLSELNPDVSGHWLAEDLDSLLARGFAEYTLVLLVLPCKSLDKIIQEYNKSSLSHSCLITVSSLGFFSTFKIYYPHAFTILDAHPDATAVTDLRLTKPWPELLEHMSRKTQKLEDMDEHDHGHVPWLLLILYYLEKWKEEHNGKLPLSYAENKKFQAFVEKYQRVTAAAGPEENYDEALAAIPRNVSDPKPRDELQHIWNAPECEFVSSRGPDAAFWIIAKALQQFYEEHGVLPLPGSLPDMKAQSTDYIELQRTYKRKAYEDSQKVVGLVRKLENQLGCEAAIPESQIELFCKNASHLRLIRGAEEVVINPPSKEVAVLIMIANPALVTHWVFEALNTFFAAADRFPGGHNADNEDAQKLSSFAKDYAKRDIDASSVEEAEIEIETIYADIDKLSKEFTRAAGGELHNISSMAGGMVSQEAIKVITKQYLPIDNECVFDGIKSSINVLNLTGSS